MYKEFKLTKRYQIAFNLFRLEAKRVGKVYHTGFHSWIDSINNFTTYSMVIYRFRILLYIEHKHKCGSNYET